VGPTKLRFVRENSSQKRSRNSKTLSKTLKNSRKWPLKAAIKWNNIAAFLKNKNTG